MTPVLGWFCRTTSQQEEQSLWITAIIPQRVVRENLNYGERSKIEVWHTEGHTAYWIARQLGRTQNTVLNAIRTGMTEQMRQGKIVRVYF